MLQLFTFSAAVLLFEPVCGVRKSFGSEGFEKQCNRPEFKWVHGARRTDGCTHSQICHSIVQNPLCSRFNRALSFSPCRLLWPLYHRASVHTLYSIHSQTRGQKRSLLSLFFIQLLSRLGSLSPSNAPSPFSSLLFSFSAPSNEIKKSFFFHRQSGQRNYTNQQTRFSLACPSFTPPPPFLSFQTLRNEMQEYKRLKLYPSTPFFSKAHAGVHHPKLLFSLFFCTAAQTAGIKQPRLLCFTWLGATVREQSDGLTPK